MYDCHAHVYPPYFTKESLLTTILPAAHAAGVQGIVAVAECVHTANALVQLRDEILQNQHRLPTLHLGLGLHPVQHVGTDHQSPISATLASLPPMLDLIHTHHQQLTCIGEIGLDFSPHVLGGASPKAEDKKQQQRAVFTAQIQLANELNLPVNVHSRSAGHHAITTLIEANCAHPALLHAFDGRPVHALRGVQYGHYFSVAPCIARSPGLEKLVATVPLDRLVLESDAPALGPVRGEDNVPANVVISAQYVARVKKVPVEDVVRMTTDNARRLFFKLGGD